MCSPEGRSCIQEKSIFSFNCSVSCEGIYADVDEEENIEQELMEHGGQGQKAKDKISRLVKEYNLYKKIRLPNFSFNPEKVSTFYGEFCEVVLHAFLIIQSIR